MAQRGWITKHDRKKKDQSGCTTGTSSSLKPEGLPRNLLIKLVDLVGIEPTTSSMP